MNTNLIAWVKQKIFWTSKLSGFCVYIKNILIAWKDCMIMSVYLELRAKVCVYSNKKTPTFLFCAMLGKL